jgi:hypothetical protein
VEQGRNAFRERRKGVMFADAPEPVFGVAVIRLPPMHDAVEPASIARFDPLGNRVRSVQMIVPQQRRAAQHRLMAGINARRGKNRRKFLLQLFDGQDTGSLLRAQPWHLRRFNRLFEL